MPATLTRTRLEVAFVLAIALAALPARADDVRACAADAEQAQRLKAGGKLRAAHELLLRCAGDPCPSEIRKDCIDWLREVDERSPSTVVSASTVDGQDVLDLRITIDGVTATDVYDGKAFVVDPGIHEFRFESPTAGSVKQRFMIREGEKNRLIVVRLGGDRSPAPRANVDVAPRAVVARWSALPWITGGISGAALGAFGFFALEGISDRAHLVDTCNGRCAKSDIDAVRGTFVAADVSLAVAVVGAAVTVAIVLLDSGQTRATARAGPLPGARMPAVDARF